MSDSNPYKFLERSIDIDGVNYVYYDIAQFEEISKLPFSIRVLLESSVRNADNFHIKETDVQTILKWVQYKGEGSVEKATEHEVPFKPARVLLQDFTGVPALVDLASMRDAVLNLGGDPKKINPICASDLVIDHSIAVDFSRSPESLQKNQDLEFERNRERFLFLKWGAKAFDNMLIIPPGSGICHQVNLEYLARVVFEDTLEDGRKILYNDSVVGTDSHTTMINGLGVFGHGVGGIEAEAVMMGKFKAIGQSIQFLLPDVIGYKLEGELNPYVTSTDLVLTITKNLRSLGVVGKFVEFFGSGVSSLSVANRSTISNMCPEFGGTVGFFPVDNNTLDYLRQTNRSESKIKIVEQYLRATKQFRDYHDESEDPIFSKVIKLDLSTVVSCLSGPKRPQDRVPVTEMKKDFAECLTNKVGFKGFELKNDELNVEAIIDYEDGLQYKLSHGSVVIAAITSCTNTSNPSVMLGAGLLAKNAIKKGLKVAPYIKTSLSPGSGVVEYYLRESNVMGYLDKLGFGIVGYGCMTCIGNSGQLDTLVASAIEKNKIVACGVLSGNRNFEGRIHALTRANYLASPLLVIAYALAGTVNIDFESQPIGIGSDGKDVYLREIWPNRDEIQEVEKKYVIPKMFQDVYSKIQLGSKNWQDLIAPDSILYPWDKNSTYIKNPPFFDAMTHELPLQKPIMHARVLLNLGDSITTDHISPAGSIARNSTAARYLSERGLLPKDFNSYGSRRGNDDVMSRGTFANIRIVNKFLNNAGPKTKHFPSDEVMDIFDCAQRYKAENIPLILLAGKEYGSGSSRDWAAKGPFLLGIRAVIAESYERIHRSNLIGMGIIPFEYINGQNAETLDLTGKETFNLMIPNDLKPGDIVEVKTDTNIKFSVKTRFDTDVEIAYYKNGGILNYMIRKMIK